MAQGVEPRRPPAFVGWEAQWTVLALPVAGGGLARSAGRAENQDDQKSVRNRSDAVDHSVPRLGDFVRVLRANGVDNMAKSACA